MASTTTPTADAPPLGAAGSGDPDGKDDTEASALPEVLVVDVGGARVALPVELTREVLRLRGATRVPGSRDWIVGLLNVRGAVVAAGDLALLAGAPPAVGPAVLVEADGRRAGLRVDAVIGVQSAALALREATDAIVTCARGLPSVGVARLQSEAAVRDGGVELPLLDVRAVLDDILDGERAL